MGFKRIDVLLVERGLAESREKAQRLIMGGFVFSGSRRLCKPGCLFDEKLPLSVAGQIKFVSRGGEKLEKAFSVFELDVNGKICLDIGASTGGFTDCLLQHGAAKVYAVDVGYGQLHWRLRQNPKVVIMERINARYLSPDMFAEKPSVATIDVSFISLTMILPPVIQVLTDDAVIVTLVKPQFEAGYKEVRKGVVRDENVRKDVLRKMKEFGEKKAYLKYVGECESPLRGPAGNIEYLMCWRKEG